MAFFQNPFFEEFRGTLPTGDRSSIKPYVVKGNAGRSFNSISAFKPPLLNNTYNLAGNDSNGDANGNLVIKFAYRDFRLFMTLTVDITGAVHASTTPTEIVSNLNLDPMFSTYFVASLSIFDSSGKIGGTSLLQQVVIDSKKPDQVKFFVVNTSAEEVLGFNKKAGVSDIPLYFARHTVDNLPNFIDSTGSLIQLSHIITNITLVVAPAVSVITSAAHGLVNNNIISLFRSNSDAVIDGNDLVVTYIGVDTFSTTMAAVTTAGTSGFWAKAINADLIVNALDANGKTLSYTLATAKFDYQLLNGTASTFMFLKQVVDANSRIISSIQYPAGSQVGNLAVKFDFTYTGLQTAPNNVTQIPHILTSADLITPP
jgi:hypothetical protein